MEIAETAAVGSGCLSGLHGGVLRRFKLASCTHDTLRIRHAELPVYPSFRICMIDTCRRELHVSTLDYSRLIESSLRSVVREVLAQVADEGLPGEHHFLLTYGESGSANRGSVESRS